MIVIGNKTMDADSLRKNYPPNSVENKIITLLSDSTEKHQYESMEQFAFELLMRKEIIQASRDLDQSRFKFRVFKDSICNPRYWNRMSDGGFELKRDARASEAIEDIFENGSKYGTECATAMLIVYFKALLRILPREKFDQLFKEIILMNWYRIHPLLTEVGYVHKVSPILPGDRLYFSNPDVNPLTPEWQGENVIDMGDGTYYGHGLGIEKPKKFIDGLNRMRRKNSEKSAYLMDVAGRPNFKSLSKYYIEQP